MTSNSGVRGQEPVKRALLLAAAGGHNVLMIGPPGAGKTMLAQRLPTILTQLTILIYWIIMPLTTYAPNQAALA